MVFLALALLVLGVLFIIGTFLKPKSEKEAENLRVFIEHKKAFRIAGAVLIYREDESLLLMIPSKEIVEVELDSRRVWSGILICGDVFRLVILKDTCPCVILADTLSQVAEALLYM